jgi:hypothetical protein
MFEIQITNIDGTREIYDGIDCHHATYVFFRARLNSNTASVEINEYVG